MKRQKPTYNSLRDYIKSKEEKKELFDIKNQFDEELWCEHLEELQNREKISEGKDKAFYKQRLDELKPLRDDSALLSFLNYKGLPKFCDFDCDGTIRKDYLKQGYYSWFPREIYRTLWNWKDLCRIKDVEFKFFTIKQYGVSCYGNGLLMGPDTMNSFWITFSAYLIADHHDTYKWNNFKNTVMFLDGENGKQRDRAGRIKELIKKDENYIRSESIIKFAELTHTIGNLILVPARYNAYRGTQPCIKDYFDLSLDNLLHGWDENRYLGENHESRKKNFNKYINTFFLWDYVDENYEPIPLCQSHKKQMEMQREKEKLEAKGVLPGKEEMDDLCIHINARIKRRSLFMIAMLRIALGVDPDGNDTESAYVYDGEYREEWADWKVCGIYKKLMEEVFLTDRIYTGGYEEVINVIKEKIAGNKDEKFVNAVIDKNTQIPPSYFV